MVFKGTVNRPKVGQISEELAGLGAQSNAFTLQECTGYYAKAAARKLPEILDIVSDLYLNPLFNAEEIEKERGVIIEELNMREDRLPTKASELFYSLVYGNQPAGWGVGGEKSVIRTATKGDFLKYRRARYVMSGMVVVVAGRFNEKATIVQIRKAFGGLPKGRASAKPKTVERQAAPRALAHFKDSGQSHLVLGFRAFDLFDKRRYALQVLADAVGGGMSSRLFKRVREELGAAYYIYAGADLSIDHGLFTVSAGVEHSKLETVVRAVLEECRRLRDEEIPARELQRTKDHMTGGIVLGLETADEVADFYGSQEILTKKLVPPEAVIAAVRKVTAADIRAVARDIFKNDRLNMAVIGPIKNAKPLQKILKL